MKRILYRYHLRFFDHKFARDLNTSFNGSTTPEQLVAMMQRVLLEGDFNPATKKFVLKIDGVRYELVIDQTAGRVNNHFTPLAD